MELILFKDHENIIPAWEIICDLNNYSQMEIFSDPKTKKTFLLQTRVSTDMPINSLNSKIQLTSI